MSESEERNIKLDIIIEASQKELFEAWTTKSGLESFLAPNCNIDLKPNGRFEILFDPSQEDGKKGSEDCIVMAYQNYNMFSFSWNSPPSIPSIREQKTSVIVRFCKINESKTKVVLIHSGWGEGEDWDKSYNYFIAAWGNIVLPRLKYSFENSPIDWNNLPNI